MSAQDVTPTRSVLLDVKKRIKLSKSGHKIMKMKRDGLIIGEHVRYQTRRAGRQHRPPARS